MSRIAVVVGSLRADSYNRQVAEAMTRLPAAEGHQFDFLEISDLPLYNQDDDSDPPQQAVRLKQQIREHDGVMFVTPEYNRGLPGVLKNAIDHASRPYGDSAWAGKPAGITGVSIGAIGTALAQRDLRCVLAYLDMPTLAQPEAYIQWTDGLVTGGEIGDKSRDFLNGWMKAFLELVDSHAG
ncbi:MAG: NADPH-dependent FMN reductase [Tsuneonella sp.]